MKKELSKKDLENLKSYDPEQFKKMSAATDIVIFSVFDEKNDNYRKLPEKKLKILLVKRGESPYLDKYALPGGFVQIDEELDEAARRELKTETSVDCEFLEPFRTTGTVDRDPRIRVMSVAYMALLDASEIQLQAGDDAASAEWFTVFMKKETGDIWNLILEGENTTLSAKIKQVQQKWSPALILEVVEWDEQIAFDHEEIIAYAILQLRKWVNESDVAFRLLPKYFTLKQLQQIYEVILDTHFLTPAFRRKMEVYVEETGEKTKDDGHRPAALYCEKKWR